MKWQEIAKILPPNPGYADLEMGMGKKRQYVAAYLPELMVAGRGLDGKKVLDVGAGTGFFCRVCKDLGHEALAVLAPTSDWKEGFMESCRFLDVKSVTYMWGSEPGRFKTNSFDVVNSEGMLGMNPPEEWAALLDEMIDCVRPGGVLMLAVNAGRASEYKGLISKWARKSKLVLIDKWRYRWKWQKSE